MKLNFDFFNLYDNLSELNEQAILTEGNYGAPKKAFLNLVNGLYYTKFDKPEGAKRVKTSDKEISDPSLAPTSTKIQEPKSAVELAQAAGVNTKETDFETGEQRDRSSSELIRGVNKSTSANKNQIALYSKKLVNPETGEEENLYTVYNKYPAILHHMNADHNDDAVIRGYTYTNPETQKKERTSVFEIHDIKLFNYVLITANTQAQAKYGHMLIHLLAMIIASIGVTEGELVDNIIKALDAALLNNNNGSTIFTIYNGVEQDGYIQPLYSLKDLYDAIKSNSNWAQIIDKYKPKTSLEQAVSDDNKE